MKQLVILECFEKIKLFVEIEFSREGSKKASSENLKNGDIIMISVLARKKEK